MDGASVDRAGSIVLRSEIRFSKGIFNTCWLAGALLGVVVVVVVVPPPQATSSMAIKARQVGRSLVINFFPGRMRDFSLFISNNLYDIYPQCNEGGLA